MNSPAHEMAGTLPLGAAEALQSVPGAVICVAEDGTVLFWNSRAGELLGIPQQQALGAAFEELDLPQPDQWRAAVARARDSRADQPCGPVCVEQTGAARWLQLRARAGRSGIVTLLVVEAYAGAAAQAATEADNRRLTEQGKRRDQFLSAMSHDLRTPVAAVMGYSELLLDGVAGPLEPPQAEMIGRIAQVAAHLSDLLDDVLDLARLDAGRLPLQTGELNIATVVEAAVMAVEPQAHAKQLAIRRRIDLPEGTVAWADAGRVRQILINVLANAIKFTEQGHLAIEAAAALPLIRISVTDTGPGLPEGSAETVFEEFIRLAGGDAANSQPGSGLGLAISRRLARAMKGDLIADDTTGSGATFTLYLPAAGTQTATAASA